MWGIAALWFGADFVGYFAVRSLKESVGLGIAWLVTIAYLLVPPMMANAVYFSHVRRKVDATTALDSDARQRFLASEGGTSATGIFVVVLIVGFFWPAKVYEFVVDIFLSSAVLYGMVVGLLHGNW